MLRLEAGFVAALLLSLALKAAMANLSPAAAEGETARSRDPVAHFLAADGFAVGAADPTLDPPLLPAARGACRLRVAEVSPYGWQRHVLSLLPRDGERLYYVFEGQAYDQQPRTRVLFAVARARILAYAGMSGEVPQVIAVIAAPGCATDGPDWTAFSG